MADEKYFLAALARLKEGLGLSKDKEVAAELGLSDKALNARKARASFPETELLALSARRPELKLDVAYILTGERVSELQREQMAVLNEVTQASGNATLIEQTADAHRAAAEFTKKRKDTYKRHLDVLNVCSETDVDLVMQLAVRLAKNTGKRKAV